MENPVLLENHDSFRNRKPMRVLQQILPELEVSPSLKQKTIAK